MKTNVMLNLKQTGIWNGNSKTFQTVQNTEDDQGNIIYLPQHLVNVCMWSRMCQECYRLPVDEECVNCGPKKGEFVYRLGETAVQASKRILKEFLEWLLYDKLNDGVLVMAHNGLNL